MTFFGADFKACFAVVIPSWFGAFVYKNLTSKVTRNVSSVVFLHHWFYVSSIWYGSTSACGLR